MADKWVSQAAAFETLKDTGLFKAGDLFPNVFTDAKGIRENDLRLILAVGRQFGRKNFKQFMLQLASTSASKQLGKRQSKLTAQEKNISLLRAFYQPMNHIIHNNLLKRTAFHLEISPSAEARSGMSLELCAKPHRSITTSNFDLCFNRKKQPTAVLANTQQLNRESAAKFREKTGLTPIRFFAQAFSHAFPGGQLLGLNLKHHSYMRPSKNVLASQFHKAGGITKAEFLAYTQQHRHPEKNMGRKKVSELVEAKEQEIITHVTKVHKSAFNGIGLNTKSRSRYYRRK